MAERTPPDDSTPVRDEHGPLSRSRLRREAITAGRDPVPPDDTTEPTTTEDRYWQAEAQRARSERDALALGVLRLADAWEKQFGETGIRADVAADTIRSAVETMGWH